jgi:hypothetical protein
LHCHSEKAVENEENNDFNINDVNYDGIDVRNHDISPLNGMSAPAHRQ